MPFRILSTLSVVVLISLILLAYGTAQESSDNQTTTNTTHDYFDSITLFSDGKITRFTQMPIQVYITQVIKESPYLPELRYAMQEWENAVEGLIRFEEIETSENADIRVSSGENNLITYYDTRLGSAELTWRNDSTQFVYSSNTLKQNNETAVNQDEQNRSSKSKEGMDFSVEIILLLEDGGTIDELSQEEMRTVCLHELGHALGLWGHSPYYNDINHATATVQHLSKRDINTLVKLYSTPPNTSQHEIAINQLKKELTVKQEHPRIHYLLGAVYYDKGDMESAIRSLQECLRLDPNFQTASHKLLQAYEKTGNQEQAIDLLEKKIVKPHKGKTQHDNATAYNHLGVLHYRQGNVDKAIQAFEKALILSPHHEPTKRNLHQLLLEKTLSALDSKEFDTAETYGKKALLLVPQNATTYHQLGKGYAKTVYHTQAIAYFQKALEINPNDKSTHRDLAQCYVRYGVVLRNDKKWDEAISAYKQALELEPENKIAIANLTDAIWQKANAYRSSGKNDEAIAAYLELQKLHPNETDILNLLGELYLKKGNYPAAVSAFQKVHTAQPDLPQAQQNLIATYQQYAQHLIKMKRFSVAIEELKLALTLFPTDINLRLMLSQAYQKTNNYAQAKAELLTILANDPNNPQVNSELFNMQVQHGNALMQRKKYSAALAEFQGISESQKDTNIYNMIGYLQLVLGKDLKSLHAFESTLAKDPRNNVAYQNILALESQLVAKLNETSASEAASTNGNTDVSEDSKTKEIRTKLLHVQCSLAICLLNRKQPKNAIAKYQQVLKANPQASQLKTLLIETGRKLANIFETRNDTKNRDTIIQQVKMLDSTITDAFEQ